MHVSEAGGTSALRPVGSYVERGALWLVVQFALFAVFVATCSRGGPRAVPILAGVLPGMLLVVSGLAITGLSFAKLTEAQTMTMLPAPLESAELATTGVYAHVRHPCYASGILVLLGVCALAGRPLALLALGALAVFFWAKAAREEALLSDLGYATYSQQVRHRFIPGVV